MTLLSTSWKSYEDVAAYLLRQCADEFGFSRVEGKQILRGTRSGTLWQIDAKGVRAEDGAVVIIECRRHTTTRQNQEKLGGLAYRILDTGAVGGIVVSPLGIQEGAEKVANAEHIVNVLLNADATPTEFCLSFLNKLFVGLEFKTAAGYATSNQLVRACVMCGQIFEVVGDETLCDKCQIISTANSP